MEKVARHIYVEIGSCESVVRLNKIYDVCKRLVLIRLLACQTTLSILYVALRRNKKLVFIVDVGLAQFVELGQL